MMDGDFPGLDDVGLLGELGATHDDLLKTATFFLALYGQSAETSIKSARFTFYTRNKKSPKVKALPPASPNLFLHVLRAHLHTMLGKRPTNNHLLMNRCISLISAGRFGMMSRCLLLPREVQLHHS